MGMEENAIKPHHNHNFHKPFQRLDPFHETFALKILTASRLRSARLLPKERRRVSCAIRRDEQRCNGLFGVAWEKLL